jgi:undecaprenyl-diphosphatase
VKVIRLHPVDVSGSAPAGGRTRWDRLGAIDWPIARALALRHDRRAPIAAANALSRLGNGPIYLPIVGAVILFHPHQALTIVLCAAASILMLHCIYPAMKRATARARPRDVEAVFPDSIPTLDKYSFPSGHVMTLTAALMPIVYSAPRTWPLGLAAWAAMSWSRLAIGHHYASDVAAGTILGAAVSGALAYCIVS